MAGQTLHMYYVYILQSKVFPDQIYKGSTENLIKRLAKHNAGEVSHTSKFRPWKIVWYCAFEQKEQSLKFEKYLKTASGIAFLRKRFMPTI